MFQAQKLSRPREGSRPPPSSRTASTQQLQAPSALLTPPRRAGVSPRPTPLCSTTRAGVSGRGSRKRGIGTSRKGPPPARTRHMHPGGHADATQHASTHTHPHHDHSHHPPSHDAPRHTHTTTRSHHSQSERPTPRAQASTTHAQSTGRQRPAHAHTATPHHDGQATTTQPRTTTRPRA